MRSTRFISKTDLKPIQRLAYKCNTIDALQT